MNCSEVQATISAYVDGELDLPEWKRVAAHIAECSPCSSGYEDVIRVGDWLRLAPDTFAAEEVWQRIEAGVRTAMPPQRLRRYRWLARAAAVAAGFVMYLLGYGAIASQVGPEAPEDIAQSRAIEQLLHDAGSALVGSWPTRPLSGFLDGRPETLLLSEIHREQKP